jgi:hypothetical protein
VERWCGLATCMVPRRREHGGGEPHSGIDMLAWALRPSPWARPKPKLSLTREERERESLEKHGHGEHCCHLWRHIEPKSTSAWVSKLFSPGVL